jgi:hypothetical protein
MQHVRPAGPLRAAIASLLILEAACAHAPAASAFEVVPRLPAVHRSHRAAWVCALAGAGLVGASFPLATSANSRYRDYLAETTPDAIPGRWAASVRADRLASGSLLAGEALIAAGTWLRFIHRPGGPGVALDLGPARCALSCRF